MLGKPEKDRKFITLVRYHIFIVDQTRFVDLQLKQLNTLCHRESLLIKYFSRHHTLIMIPDQLIKQGFCIDRRCQNSNEQYTKSDVSDSTPRQCRILPDQFDQGRSVPYHGKPPCK